MSQGGRDRTETYLGVYDKADAAFANVKHSLKDCIFLFVPGFLGEFFLGFYSFRRYFDENISALEREGFGRDDLRVVSTDTEAPIAENAKTIIEAIRAAKSARKKAFIISHSKGGLDTLEALIRGGFSKNDVLGWVALQAPFGGTPIAERADDIFPNAVDFFLKLFGGRGKTVSEMRRDTRREYLKKHANDIRTILGEIPMLSFRTRVRDRTIWPDTPLEAGLKINDAERLESDAVVPTESAILPGSKHVFHGNVDHLITVFRYGNARIFFGLGPIDQGRMTKALIAMTLS